MTPPPGTALAGGTAMLSPFRLGTVDLRNRVAVASMTRVSATADGLATGRMADYYRAFAEGGFGLVITEGVYTDKAFAQGYLHQPGLTDNAQAAAWRRVTGQVHAAGGKIVAQLMHAGALSQGNPHRTGTVGPSAVLPMGAQMAGFRGSGPYRLPTEMGPRGIAQAVDGFAAAAIKAQAAGFDGVEVHGANGYLLDQFLTEGVNRREDAYGGPTLARARLMAETLAAVRAVAGPSFLVGVWVSQTKVNDHVHSWAGREDDARVIFSTLGAGGADYIHTTEHEAWRQAFAGGGRSLAALAKAHAGLPVIANGALHDPARATAMLRSGEADMVALARGALANTDWPERVRDGRAILEFDRESLSPLADLASSDARTDARRAAEAATERKAAGRAQEVAQAQG
jgi:2,4-dienoyl-CoA reductase-like NADH-dependent reductase (Old Yellow Enzyme family)